MIFGGFEKCTLIDFPGKIACMVYTIGCPFRCPYCHNPELVDETASVFFDEQEIIYFLETRKGLLDGVVITGGEPSMHGDNLISFIKKIKKIGFLVKLDTNGVAPLFLQRVIAEKLIDYIAMDIKAPFSKYSEVVGRPVYIDAIKKSISCIMQSGIPYEFRTTLVKSQLSFGDIKEIGESLEGAQMYYLQKFIPTKILNPQFLRKTSYSDDELKELQTMMLSYVKNCEIRS